MLNQLVIAGRLTKNPEIKELENGKKVTTITVAVPRSYKNVNGEYDTDFITCTLWNGIAETTCEYCKKGDIVGVKGRVQSNTKINEDNSMSYTMEVVAEKVSFLSSKKSNDEEE